MGKDSFLLYKSFYQPVSGMSDKQLGRLFRAIFKHQLGEVVTVEGDIEMAFNFFVNQFNLDEAKYKGIVERNRENGRKGGAPKGNVNAKSTGKENIIKKTKQPKQPTGSQTTQNKLNDNDIISTNVDSNISNIKESNTDVLDEKVSVPAHDEDKSKSDYEKFNDWIKSDAPNVLKLQRQITEPQFLKMKGMYDTDQIIFILRSMDNYKDLTKKYVSVYQTFLNWAKREYA